MEKLKIVKVYDDAKIPCKPKTRTDAGYDIYAYKIEKIFTENFCNEVCLEECNIIERLIDTGAYSIKKGDRVLINTGIKATIGEGWELQVRPRSGNALKRGLTVCNTPGTIDPDYRGIIGVILINVSNRTQYIKMGEAIAQIVPSKIYDLEIEEVDRLDKTIRGNDGYGSTDFSQKESL